MLWLLSAFVVPVISSDMCIICAKEMITFARSEFSLILRSDALFFCICSSVDAHCRASHSLTNISAWFPFVNPTPVTVISYSVSRNECYHTIQL